MKELFSELLAGIELTGDVECDVCKLLRAKGCEEVVEHTMKVADRACRLAARFGVDEEAAYIAGLLHDIGNVVPSVERAAACNEFGIEVLEEERIAPSLLHGKLSAAMARYVFETDETVCNAIECHSTLRKDADRLDMVLFVADKTSWDSIYNGEFIEDMQKGLEISLEHAAFAYLKHLLGSEIKVKHPWAIDAYNYLRRTI